MVRNESVRFGRHVDIEVSYKILQLEIPKLVLILHYLACFQKGTSRSIDLFKSRFVYHLDFFKFVISPAFVSFCHNISCFSSNVEGLQIVVHVDVVVEVAH